ncbi:hypothetical protein Pmani_030889 [Petrolisthes manimaculis]|uniref:Uncharacterized protein n=1 Tax=Petrolisthes manimaculis TaxID=1843537 RepID=A0AAE1NUR2_9EUCA|nr:hypothetical protein Pmani_030889 [Petrolisthes manimaculis]
MKRAATDTSTGGTHKLTTQYQSNMKCLGGRGRPIVNSAGILAAILIAFFVTPAASQEESLCFDHVTIIDGPDLVGIETSMGLRLDVSETTPKGTYMYTIVVDEDVTPTLQAGDEFFTFFSVTPDGRNWTVEQCTLELEHTILDENTQPPNPDQPSYTYDIREDFPIDLNIPDFTISVTDLDETEPNNQFTVTVDWMPLGTF